jgi:KTSC domain
MMPLICSRSLINAVAVESSAIARVAYDQQWRILQIEFRDGVVCQYTGVPLQTYQELLLADSKGGYFNRYIRPHFPRTRAGSPA